VGEAGGGVPDTRPARCISRRGACLFQGMHDVTTPPSGVDPVSLPATSAIPGGDAETCTEEDYDRYFGLARDAPGLLEWSRTCLSLQERVLGDLDDSLLSAEDKCQLLAGLVTVGQLTLQRWVAVAVAARAREAGCA